MLTIGVSGHRPTRLGFTNNFAGLVEISSKIFEQLNHELWDILGLGKEDVILTGMASGFDTAVGLWARKTGVPYICCVKERVNTEHMTFSLARCIDVLFESAKGVVYFNSYKKRDDFIAESSDIAVICWDGGKGNVKRFRKNLTERCKKVVNLYETFRKT